MAINLYVYVAALPMVGFADQTYRITYREVENSSSIETIRHPVIREVLRDENYTDPLNIAILSDVPGGTGLGSSSAFTVGFIKLIKALKGTEISRFNLAKQAIFTERELLQEHGGVQDQLHAAMGGLSRYSFFQDSYSVTPVSINQSVYGELNKSIYLIYTGKSRHASNVLTEQITKTKEKKIVKELSHLNSLVDQGMSVFQMEDAETMLIELGAMLNEAWRTKRSISSSISTPRIDEMFEKTAELGAYGAKLCGAGGGGFMMVLASPDRLPLFQETFGPENVYRVNVDEEGSRISTRF
ncbi:GHMP kinase [Desulfosediminicola sp.]|uniref:GHMP family kinase ATP-binding protein n=1 Tax=Desulfosediminicola sp. TaxID=2886825 RepID=UPI003AF2B2D8